MKITELMGTLKEIQKKHPNLHVGVDWASFESPDYTVETHIECETRQITDVISDKKQRMAVLFCRPD